MNDSEEWVKNRELLLKEQDRVLLDFLNVDLDTSMTMLGIASDPNSSSERKERNKYNARRAYDAISYFLAKVSSDNPERQKVTERLRLLRSSLERLGEVIPPEPHSYE